MEPVVISADEHDRSKAQGYISVIYGQLHQLTFEEGVGTVLRPVTVTPRRLTIKRQFAAVLEDAIEVDLPLDVDHTDPDAVEEWAVEHWDRLYEEARFNWFCVEAGDGRATTSALLWEDEHRHSVENVDDVWITEYAASPIPYENPTEEP